MKQRSALESLEVELALGLVSVAFVVHGWIIGQPGDTPATIGTLGLVVCVASLFCRRRRSP